MRGEPRTGETKEAEADNKIPLKAEAETVLHGAKLKGRVALTLYQRSKSASTTPLLLVEVGLNGADWWKNFHQGVTYVQIKYEK